MSKLEMTEAGAGSKQAPNKVLLGILGVLCAVALFMFVVKPLVFGAKDEPSGGSPGAAAPSAGADTTSPDASTGGTGDTGSAGSTPTAPDTGATLAPGTEGEVTGGSSGTSVEAAKADLPAEFAGKSVRDDPFASLEPEDSASSTASTP